jgi:MYXO-CTERM domain-containing protein
MFHAAALIAFLGWLGAAEAYIIESEPLGGDPVGNPPQSAYKVTISVPSDPANDPGNDSFTVNWVVPKEQTSPTAPADLTADAVFRITSFDASALVMEITLNNTFDPALGINAIVAFGFNVDPDVTSVSLVNHADPNNVIWTHQLESNLTGNFKNLDICIYPDSNNCNGGSVLNGLPAGASDVLTLTLTGNFLSAETGTLSAVMLSEFPVKFQGDFGSYAVPGETGCCGSSVPEPHSLALGLFGIALVELRRRRARLRVGA